MSFIPWVMLTVSILNHLRKKKNPIAHRAAPARRPAGATVQGGARPDAVGGFHDPERQQRGLRRRRASLLAGPPGVDRDGAGAGRAAAPARASRGGRHAHLEDCGCDGRIGARARKKTRTRHGNWNMVPSRKHAFPSCPQHTGPY